MTLKIYIIFSLLLLLVGCGTIEGAKKIPAVVPETKRSEIAKSFHEELKAETKNCIFFDDFSDPATNNWTIINDGVMGGLSKGNYAIENGVLVLAGNINTNGGGFSSIRTRIASGLLEESNYIRVSAKVDTRGYQITFRDNNRRGISHQSNLVLENTGAFEEIIIPITDLTPRYFGRNVAAAAFNKKAAREIGFIISDGKDGAFQIEIGSIEFCK